MTDADTRFARCVAFVCGASIEGGYVDNPHDRGGPTNHGITLATLEAWRRAPCTANDVKALTQDEATAIYRANFWNAVRGDDLPAGPDLVTFDAAVNQGPGRAARFLQAAAGAGEDGVIGPGTLGLVAKADPNKLIDRIKAERMTAYWASPDWNTFGRGWANRINAVVAQAHAWAGAPA